MKSISGCAMTPELWARLNPLFNAAVEKPLDEQNSFIAEACGDDAELRRELKALVEAHAKQDATTDKVVANIKELINKATSRYSPSDVIFGRFRIVRLLGSGGMGEVYEAFDLELSQTVALKSIRPDIAGQTGVLSRFRKEVQLARRLTGPNICRIHELFVAPGNTGSPVDAFLTMEFLEGITLSEELQERGPIAWDRVKQIGIDICTALTTMHDAGIIHRDLKSRNIMLAERNGKMRAVLMDFGLAHETAPHSSGAETTLTTPGTFIGTPQYMAPEQFEGKAMSPATDIYATGIVIYELLTGKHPFAAASALEAAVLRGKKPEPASSLNRDVPHRVDLAIEKCLRFNPSERFQTAADLADALLNPFSRLTKLPFQPVVVSRRRIAIVAVILALAALPFFWRRSTSYRIPDQRALKWYEDGTTALREGAYLKATSELQEAVNLAPTFDLAHARLAQAWDDLDFTGAAEHEMLLASTPERLRTLPAMDRRYINAVRNTLMHDLDGSVREYSAILEELPEEQKGFGYLDLGLAQEKAGKIPDSIKSYESAAALTPDNPAPYVHLGVLKSRQQDSVGAEAAYDKAEHLYSLTHNLEGLGEVAFQRGHSANERGDTALAKASLENCLQIAKQIPSVQLEVRALTQLSNVEYYSDRDDQAILDARKAIQLAQENNLEYWATDGLIREANAYFDKGGPDNLTTAENLLVQALKQAQANQHPHLEANAKFSLASLRDIQEKRDEQIKWAQSALKYFVDFGFLGQANETEILIVRGERGKGNLSRALQSSMELLDVANRSGSAVLVEGAQETIGGVLLELENYPQALTHYEEALRLSRMTNENVPYQMLGCADVFWRLGRYEEAATMLNSIPDQAARRPDIALAIAHIQAGIFLSQKKFAEAMKTSLRAVDQNPKLSTSGLIDFKSVSALALAQTGKSREAQEAGHEVLALAQKTRDEKLIAEATLTQATLDLQAGSPESASSLAEAANSYFASKGQTESDWLSLLYAAEAARVMGDKLSSAQKTKQVVDKLSTIEQNWSSSVFNQYRSRPDIQTAMKRLSKLEIQ
jgi:serine/threonine protein kinase